MWNTLSIIIGIILTLLGFLGCILPVLPGPPLSFVALLILAVTTNFAAPLTAKFIFIMLIVTIAVTAMDYIVPVVGAKKYGASKWGLWGSILGMILGIIFFPPLGFIIGAFFGAVMAEMIAGKSTGEAIKAGMGVFVGALLGTILKLIAAGIMAYYFILALFSFFS